MIYNNICNPNSNNNRQYFSEQLAISVLYDKQIDVVFTWCNGSDPTYLAQRSFYFDQQFGSDKETGENIHNNNNNNHSNESENYEDSNNENENDNENENTANDGDNDNDHMSGSNDNKKNNSNSNNNNINNNNRNVTDNPGRYRYHEELLFSVRSLDMYAPWIR